MKISRILKASQWSAIGALVPLAIFTGPANANFMGGQWYIGIGGTGAWLQPDPEQPGNNVSEAVGTGGTVFLGKDLDERSSLQFQAISLGEALLDDGNVVTYNSADASVLYRFFDTRDNNLNGSVFGTSFYGRFALGYMMRESDTDLEKRSEVYFGVGAGTETYVTKNIALRLEGFLHDLDSVSGSLSLVFRFGGTLGGGGLLPNSASIPRAPQLSNAGSASTQSTAESASTNRTDTQNQALQGSPSPETSATAEQSVSSAPQQIESSGGTRTASLPDSDSDGVADTSDLCGNSTPNYPVRGDGCALFDGVLSGIKFIPGSEKLAAGSETQLNFLADLLTGQYPNARIELHSHTDNSGDLRQQSILTRARLRTVGTYLVDKGVGANQLVLRSFGGSRPLYENATPAGRSANNRIEVLERPR